MKRPSLNFGEGGIQGFLLRHVEKFVLGVAVLLVVVFVYMGWNIEPFDKTPDKLKSLAERAQQHIMRDTWENVKGERLPPSGLKTKVVASRTKTAADPYWNPLPLKPPVRSQHTKRQDPQIFAATKLEVIAVIAAVAMKPATGREDVLTDEPNAEPPKEDEVARKRREAREKRERQRNERRGGGGGGVPGMAGGMGGMGGPPGMGDVPGMGDDGGAAMPGMPGVPGMPGGDAAPGSGGMFGGGATGSSTAGVRRFRGEVEGWQPGSGGAPSMSGPAMPGMGPSASGGSNVVPQSQSFVAVKALVPYQKQFEEFQRALEGPFFEARRDMPSYIYIWVERAEVSDDPSLPLAWTQLETRSAERLAEQYAGYVREIADAKYVDVPAICHPVPPILMHPLDELLTHGDLPRKTDVEAAAKPGEVEQPKESGDDLPGGDLPTGRGPAGRRPGQGFPSMGGGMAPPGMDGGMTPPGAEMDGMGAGGYGGSAPMDGAMGMPGGGMSGMPGSLGGPGFEVPKFKLVRFFDFTVEPGKTYKYRVKLFIEDPNNPNPNGRSVAPTKRMLAPEVIARLDDPQRNKKEFWRTTDWSEPSEAVKVALPNSLFAGGVTPGKTTKLEDQIVPLEEPSGTLVPVVWDSRRAVAVPAERPVFRGSMLNFSQTAEVVHPVSLIIKMLKDFSFKTNSLVVDLRGGEVLPGAGEEKLTAPGEFAVIDASGELVVVNELDDVEAFRRYTLADEKEQATGSGPAGAAGPAGMGPPGMGPPGMGPPGMGPPGMGPPGMGPPGMGPPGMGPPGMGPPGKAPGRR